MNAEEVNLEEILDGFVNPETELLVAPSVVRAELPETVLPAPEELHELVRTGGTITYNNIAVIIPDLKDEYIPPRTIDVQLFGAKIKNPG